MKEIVRKISLDFTRKSNVRVAFANQCDMNSRRFLISLYDDGEEYPVSSETVAAINVLRADETNASFIAEVTSEGKISFTAGAWTLGVVGKTKLSVSLYEGEEKKLTGSYFEIDVAPGLYLGDDIDNDDKAETTFSSMMNRLAVFNENEEERKAEENARVLNEQMRISAENIRSRQESERQEYDDVREQNEAQRQSNENERRRNEAERIAAEEERDRYNEILIQALEGLIATQQAYILGDELISEANDLLRTQEMFINGGGNDE